MPKKTLIENQNDELNSEAAATKPVKTARKVFKDNQAPEVYSESGATVPVKAKSRKPAAQPQEAELSSIETAVASVDSATPAKPKKVRRGKWVWLGVLIMLVITAIGSAIGYSSAMKVRITNETNQRLELATTSFVKAERDIANGDLNMASQRLQYIMTIYPEYPGLEDKLKEVLTAIALANPDASAAQPTPDAAFTPVATKDTSELSVLFPQAQNQLISNDWKGLLDTVNKMRDIDPSYEALKVDGFYYFALRNNGIAKINAGHLEVGLYYFAMASKIAPLDAEALSLGAMARSFLEAESYFGVDYFKSTELLAEVAKQIPNMVDVSGVTAKQRYVESLIGIGDVLMLNLDYCNAALQYSAARDILSSDEVLLKVQQASDYCSNPPPLPTPTLEAGQPTPTLTPESYQPTD